MILHLPRLLLELSQQTDHSESVLKLSKRSLKGQSPHYWHYTLSVCGDTVCSILNSQVAQTKLNVHHVQFSSSPLRNATADKKPAEGSATIDLIPSVFYSSPAASTPLSFHLYCFLICSPSLSLPLPLFFSSPSCIFCLLSSFLPFTVSFLTPKCESLYI